MEQGVPREQAQAHVGPGEPPEHWDKDLGEGPTADLKPSSRAREGRPA